jgi:hypothetical protein
MMKRTRRIVSPTRADRAPLHIVRSRVAEREEVSRIIRLTPMLRSLEPVETQPLRVRLDSWAAFAAVPLASSAIFQAALWMLDRWQLR